MRENTGRWSVTFTGATAIATLVLGLGLPTAQLGAPAASTPTDGTTAPTSVEVAPARTTLVAGSRVTARWSRAIDTSSMSAVNKAYNTAYAPKLTEVVSWLGGSLLSCLPGLVSGATNASTLSSLNFVRSLAGLGPVSFSSTMNAAAQKAALIMAANDDLSHYPTTSWRCWSSAGAKAAAKSNLAIARPYLRAGQIIDLYMDDPGSNNTAAGHRRWLLNPFATVMGSGTTKTANAITVIGPTNASRPNPRWVGWPTAGYFPNALEPNGRWSLSAGLKSVNFKYASVAVYQGTKKISVRKYTVHNGYGQPTIVWQMPSTFSKTHAYKVVVSGIRQSGVAKPYSKSYTVRLFTPSQ